MQTHYKITATGVVLSPSNLGTHFPNVSFPAVIGAATLAELGLIEVLVPEPEPVMQIPQVVTRKQARKALVLAGHFDAVQPAIDAIADPLQRRLAQIDWDDAQEYDRSDPFLEAMAGALELDAAALDALFALAAGL